MAEEEKQEETTEEVPSAEETPAEEAPKATEAAVAPVAEPDPDADLPAKERRRLKKSRRPHKSRPQLSPEEREAERRAERARKAKARSKRRAAERAAEASKEKGPGTPPAEHEPNKPKVRQGIVVSNKGDKTITVRIDIARRHPVYEKIVRRGRTLHAHDERNEAGEGDTVQVIESRPLSKTKRWRLVEILEKAK